MITDKIHVLIITTQQLNSGMSDGLTLYNTPKNVKTCQYEKIYKGQIKCSSFFSLFLQKKENTVGIDKIFPFPTVFSKSLKFSRSLKVSIINFDKESSLCNTIPCFNNPGLVMLFKSL